MSSLTGGKSSAPAPSPGFPVQVKSGTVRLVAVGAVLVLLTAAAVISYRQPAPAPRDPLPGWLSPKWWLKPIEQSSGLRPGAASLHTVAFTSAKNGWAIGADGAIVTTQDGGREWDRQSSGTSEELWAMAFADPLHGWIMGDHGTALQTVDGGTSWKLVAPFASAVPNGAQANAPLKRDVPNGRVANSPVVNASPDGTLPNLISLVFVTAQSGWVVGTHGTILHTEDGGQTWTAQESGTTAAFRGVSFISPTTGYAVGNGGTVLRTEDGGTIWKPDLNLRADYSNVNFYAVSFPTPLTGWICGSGGTILRTSDGGKSWALENSNATAILTNMSFVSSTTGWVVGSGHTMLHTTDGGASWSSQDVGSGDWLRGIAFPTNNFGWAVGGGETILHTNDGGATWKVQGYHRLPGPWFFLVAVLSVVALLWATQPNARQEQVEFIENLVSADAPVEQLRLDALGYTPLVMRLVRFIQNPKTSPPLVMAIQAPWGMGKSSVMSMLRTELKKNRTAVCVWFNAWHHQKEDQLLAYLMDAVQRQVAPSWFSAVGIKFRFNLLRVRMFSSPERFLQTAAVFAALPLTIALASLGWKNVWGFILPVGWIGAMSAANLLRTFGADPQKLLAKSGKSPWKSMIDLVVFPSLQGKTDVRYQFAHELSEVVDALLPQRLVIFLDDLDRCRPEQVVDILESINFLSSAAPCFIFVGADYRKVETLAGQHFEAIAMQEAENVAHDAAVAQTGQPSTIVARMEYARNYMLKIVNMRLDLPKPNSKGFANLIRQSGRAIESSKSFWQRWAIAALITLSLSATVAIALHYVASPVQPEAETAGASQVVTQVPAEDSSANTTPASNGATGNGALGGTANAGTGQAGGGNVRDDGNTSTSDAGTTWSHRLTILIPILVGLIVFIRVRSTPKDQEKAVDSKAFSDALDRVAPQIQKRCVTPREVRRFQNYLRFLAAWDDSGSRPVDTNLEGHLVELAAAGITGADGSPRIDMPVEVIEFFVRECQMLGLDPNSFRPEDDRPIRHDGPGQAG
jgi:photosystem II stability/assembly factor-like uncharacterized protein